MAVKKIKELEVKIANKVGAGAQFLAMFAAARVNLLGVCGYSSSSGKDAYMLVVPNNVRKAKNVLKKAGYKNVKSADVLKVDLSNRPGALKDVLTKLASAKVDVNYAYALAVGKNGVAIINAKPFARALKALK